MAARAIETGSGASTAGERPSKEEWFRSEPYQRLVQATRANDHVRQAHIIEEAIASTIGADKAFWLLYRSVIRTYAAARAPVMLERSWSDLEEAFRIAPDDDRIRESTLQTALSLCTQAQDLGRLMPIFQALRRDLPRLKDAFFVTMNFGFLQVLRGRWRAGYRALSRAEAAMFRLSPQSQANFRGWLALIYSQRAIAALGCGRPDLAERDIAVAAETYERLAVKFQAVYLAIPRAELALFLGRPQEARAELQRGLAEDLASGQEKVGPAIESEIELLAARITRAEGNEQGFAHFCERALTIAQQHNLAMSMARVRAVMDGAER